jgi:hypothetical protein
MFKNPPEMFVQTCQNWLIKARKGSPESFVLLEVEVVGLRHTTNTLLR